MPKKIELKKDWMNKIEWNKYQTNSSANHKKEIQDSFSEIERRIPISGTKQ